MRQSQVCVWILVLMTKWCVSEDTCQEMLPEEGNFCGYSQYLTNDPNVIIPFGSADWKSLEEVGCSNNIKFYICAFYRPRCTRTTNNDYIMVKPCQSLCYDVLRNCEIYLTPIGDPASLPAFQCSTLPDEQPCIDIPETATENNIVKPNYETANSGCPVDLSTETGSSYSITKAGKSINGCALPCKPLFHNGKEITIIRNIILAICISTFLSSFIIMATAVMNKARFHYPDRPIIYIALCFFNICLAYFIGYGLTEKSSCEKIPSLVDSNTLLDTLIQGTRSEICTVLFLIKYFFTYAAFLWWFVLGVSWFLTAAFAWSPEAIGSSAQYFHVVCWVVPGIQSIVALATGHLEGDSILGICSTPWLTKKEPILFYEIVPGCIYLGSAFLLLFIAFFNLISIKKEMGTDQRTDKMEKLIVKVAIISLIFTFLASVYLGCLIINYLNRDAWLNSWFALQCYTPGKSSASCNSIGPGLYFPLLQNCCLLLAGFTSNIWAFSGKTGALWKRCCSRICCKDYNNDANLRDMRPIYHPVVQQQVPTVPSNMYYQTQYQQSEQLSGRLMVSNPIQQASHGQRFL